jgi:hypothetical protein
LQVSRHGQWTWTACPQLSSLVEVLYLLSFQWQQIRNTVTVCLPLFILSWLRVGGEGRDGEDNAVPYWNVTSKPCWKCFGSVILR